MSDQKDSEELFWEMTEKVGDPLVEMAKKARPVPRFETMKALQERAEAAEAELHRLTDELARLRTTIENHEVLFAGILGDCVGVEIRSEADAKPFDALKRIKADALKGLPDERERERERRPRNERGAKVGLS